MLTILLMVIIPFVCGLAAYYIGKKKERSLDGFAVLVTLCETALAVILFFQGEISVFLTGLSIPLSFSTGSIHSVYAFITAFTVSSTVKPS